jgi:hypothetical protein
MNHIGLQHTFSRVKLKVDGNGGTATHAKLIGAKFEEDIFQTP